MHSSHYSDEGSRTNLNAVEMDDLTDNGDPDDLICETAWIILINNRYVLVV